MKTHLSLEEIIDSELKINKSIFVERRLKSLFRFSVAFNLSALISFVGILLLKLVTGVYIIDIFTNLYLSLMFTFSLTMFLFFLVVEITDLLYFKKSAFQDICLVYESDENLIL